MYYGTLYNYSNGDYYKLAAATVKFDADDRPWLREPKGSAAPKSASSTSTSMSSLGSLIDEASCESSYTLSTRCMRSPLSLHPLKAPIAYLSWWRYLTDRRSGTLSS